MRAPYTFLHLKKLDTTENYLTNQLSVFIPKHVQTD